MTWQWDADPAEILTQWADTLAAAGSTPIHIDALRAGAAAIRTEALALTREQLLGMFERGTPAAIARGHVTHFFNLPGALEHPATTANRMNLTIKENSDD